LKFLYQNQFCISNQAVLFFGSGLSLNQIEMSQKFVKVCCVFDIKFRKQVISEGINGCCSDERFSSNLFVDVVFSNKLKHLFFSSHHNDNLGIFIFTHCNGRHDAAVIASPIHSLLYSSNYIERIPSTKLQILILLDRIQLRY
jgi:hypothetical protein